MTMPDPADAAPFAEFLQTAEQDGAVCLVIDPRAPALTIVDVIRWLNRRQVGRLDLDLVREAFRGPRGMAHRITASGGPTAAAPLPPARRALLAEMDGKALLPVRTAALRRGLDVRHAVGFDTIMLETAERPPDVIVIDVSIGTVSALTACRQLTRGARTAGIPVLLACQEATHEFLTQALQAGARDLMVHPIAPDVVVRKLARVLEAVGKSLPAPPPGSAADGDDMPQVLGRVNLAKLLNEATPLHGIPAVVERVVRLSADEEAGAGELAQALRMDDASTTAVLRVANSAAYGGSRRITSLDDAVTRIGFRQTRSLVVGRGIVQSFGSRTQSVGFDRAGCWRHALAAAILSRQIAQHTRKVSTDVAFIAGLVHDVGRVLLDELCPGELEEAVRYAIERGVTLTQAEREVLQTSHVEIATQALRKWSFPDEIVDAVKYHHGLPPADVFRAPHRPLCETVLAADMLACATGVGRSGTDTRIAEVPEAVWSSLGLTGGLPAGFWKTFDAEFRDAHAFLGLAPEDAPMAGATRGTAVLADLDGTPVSALGVVLQSCGWALTGGASPAAGPATATPPAFVVVRSSKPEAIPAVLDAWRPVAAGAPVICIVPDGCTPPAGTPSLVEPYDRDALLRLLPEAVAAPGAVA